MSWLKDIPRQKLLYLVTGAVVGLFVLDNFVVEPAIHAWGEQSERIEALQKKVERGRVLLERESSIRGRWAEMGRANLQGDDSAAGNDALNAVNRWKLASGIGLSSLAPAWQSHDDTGYDAFECRATVTGDQAALGRFIYALETDALPVNLEETEISTRDTHGQQLTLTARFSFARLATDSSGKLLVPTVSSGAAGNNNNPNNNNSGRSSR